MSNPSNPFPSPDPPTPGPPEPLSTDPKAPSSKKDEKPKASSPKKSLTDKGLSSPPKPTKAATAGGGGKDGKNPPQIAKKCTGALGPKYERHFYLLNDPELEYRSVFLGFRVTDTCGDLLTTFFNLFRRVYNVTLDRDSLGLLDPNNPDFTIAEGAFLQPFGLQKTQNLLFVVILDQYNQLMRPRLRVAVAETPPKGATQDTSAANQVPNAGVETPKTEILLEASKDTGTGGKGGSTHGSTTMLQEPPKIANSIIEKKIRNLEKRKVRLLEIKALEDKGQQLEADQKNAVKKLDNVMEMIDMLKEIGKNVTDGLNDHAKQVKKLQKKEQMEKQAERQQQDLMRVKLLLNMHFILSRFSAAKNDLLQGENGAIKLDENQVDSLESLSSVLSPQSFDLIEQSAEKINYLLQGHKREFVSGLSYSDLKESLIKLIESNYFENVSISDKIVDSSSESIQNDKPAEENDVPVESVQNDSEVIAKEQTETKQPIQNNVHQMSMSNQLCFIRDTVVENELQHKDPAVVAVASSGFTFPPQIGPLSTSSGSNIITPNSISSHYPPNIYPIQSSVSIPIQGSIPTQTFTNPSYNYGNGYIPVSLAGPISHQMIPEQHIPIRNIGTDAPAIVQNNVNELANEKNDQFLSEPIQNEASNLQANQDADGKPITNGQVENGYYKRNNRGRGGNFVGNPNYRGRGAKNFGYFNGGNNGNVSNSQNGNFNSNRPVNRQNGGGNRSGYRQDRGVPRNQTNDQSAPVSAK